MRANIRNRYNQAPHLTQDLNGKMTTSQLDITNESQEVSPFPEGESQFSFYSILKGELTEIKTYIYFTKQH